ncbi:hypothetical protein BESB_003950 [Besnoitia besnoiti]|uniref:Uncharacterized protein n=1 Tax=Besnoitia besnoiti TaxID=94643 RepID=A0A2A9MLC4_BESBE|nr:hypothetical protein BESB_003950 [Besnoitia besnoiti]PFH38054.1 hypothetical protein BESB_003950 [Besnoitia besnoiti]
MALRQAAMRCSKRSVALSYSQNRAADASSAFRLRAKDSDAHPSPLASCLATPPTRAFLAPASSSTFSSLAGEVASSSQAAHASCGHNHHHHFHGELSSSSASAAPAAGSSSEVAGTSALEQIPLRDPLVNPTFSAQKIPKDYVKKTLIPHLENQITTVSKALNELELANLATAYAKLPKGLRHPELVRELVERVKFRMDGFGAQEIVLILYPLYSMVGARDGELWRMFAERVEKEFILKELSVLNLLSILRVYEKLEASFGDEFEAFIATLQELLKAGIQHYDAIELHDILLTISFHHRQTKRDLQLLRLVLAEMDAKIQSLSLLNQLAVLQALIRMKVEHRELANLVASQIQDERQVHNMPPKFVAQTVWIFARLGRLSDVACTVGPLMEQHVNRFSVVDFARLAQALPAGSSVPLRVCKNLQGRLATMTTKEFCFFVCACVRLNLLPDQEGRIPYFSASQEDTEDLLSGSSALIASIDSAGLLDELFSFMAARESEFSREEIRRIILVLQGYEEDYGYLLERLPEGWTDVGESLDSMEDKQEGEEKTE